MSGTRVAYFPLMGGEDLLSPSLSVNPGRLRYSKNYECDRFGRYRRYDGYERFDGRPKPSESTYWILSFDAGETEIEAEDILTGASSSAYGEVLSVTVSTGTWAGSDAAGFAVLFNVSGIFQNNEDLEVSSSKVAEADGTATEQGADNDTDHDTYLQAAIEATRADIQAVTGSGDILGVWQYKGVKYAFRNNAGGTEAVMFKSSTSGWTQCDIGRTVAFTSGGTTEIEEDDVVTGATSSAFATVKRVILSSGTWAGGDAAGTFVLYTQTGDFQSENLNVGAATNIATIAGNSAEVTLLPDGRYEFLNKNFGGHASTQRMYGCDGENKAFEWDGSTFVQITTGMTTDTPIHITEYHNHLFLMFTGGSIQHSSITAPYEWSAVTGAAEIAIGDEGTGFLKMVNVLAIFARNSTYLLYGSSSADWELRQHSDEAGAIEWTMQRIGDAVYLDDKGLTTLSATDAYGDFASNVISRDIQPFIDSMRGYESASIRVRAKNQYRLFYSDGQAVTMTMDGSKVVGFTRLLFDDPVVCCCSVENTAGDEELFFGSSDGFVYQMDSGTSLDGGAIEDIIQTHYNHIKSPSVKKRFRKAVVELDAPNNITINVSLDYGDSDGQTAPNVDVDIDEAGGHWGVDSWDSFVWDGPFVSTGEARFDGSGTSISMTFYHTGIYDQPHTIQGVVIHYDPRGLRR